MITLRILTQFILEKKVPPNLALQISTGAEVRRETSMWVKHELRAP